MAAGGADGERRRVPLSLMRPLLILLLVVAAAVPLLVRLLFFPMVIRYSYGTSENGTTSRFDFSKTLLFPCAVVSCKDRLARAKKLMEMVTRTSTVQVVPRQEIGDLMSNGRSDTQVVIHSSFPFCNVHYLQLKLLLLTNMAGFMPKCFVGEIL